MSPATPARPRRWRAWRASSSECSRRAGRARRTPRRWLRCTAPGDRVVAGRQRARAAEAVQELIDGHEARGAVEPRIELAVEEGVRAAVHEGDRGRGTRGEAQLCV